MKKKTTEGTAEVEVAQADEGAVKAAVKPAGKAAPKKEQQSQNHEKQLRQKSKNQMKK